jgi:SARP family transcriptional regulator, regulator of embCAB operon
VRYEILGPLRVVDGDVASLMGAQKLELLLTVLLIRANQVVSINQLAAELWGSVAPSKTAAGIQVYICKLRKFLNDMGGPTSRISTQSSGYVLQLGNDQVDYQLFEQSMRVGRKEAYSGHHECAAICFKNALELWRGASGAAFGGWSAGPIVNGFVRWAAEAYLECTEMFVESQLQLRCHREVVSQLYSLVVEYPLRETFYRQLMLALYRSGLRGDALLVYHLARERLNDELGLEPGHVLQELRQAILTADTGLDPRGNVRKSLVAATT